MAKGMFISNRDVQVNSVFGHSVLFKKGVPTYAPPPIRKECIEKGILPVEGVEEATAVLEAEDEKARPKIHLAPEDPDERKASIEAACMAIAKSNNSRDFTGGGVPNAQAVTAALGWKVDQSEIKDVWKELKPKILAKG